MQGWFIGKQDVYIEIAERFEKYIATGVYKQGDRLPSVRTTASELGVNPNTVARAYSLLEERGIIVTLPKKGVYVRLSSQTDEIGEGETRRVITELRDRGVPLEKLISIIEEVYGNDQDK